MKGRKDFNELLLQLANGSIIEQRELMTISAAEFLIKFENELKKYHRGRGNS